MEFAISMVKFPKAIIHQMMNTFVECAQEAAQYAMHLETALNALMDTISSTHSATPAALKKLS